MVLYGGSAYFHDVITVTSLLHVIYKCNMVLNRTQLEQKGWPLKIVLLLIVLNMAHELASIMHSSWTSTRPSCTRSINILWYFCASLHLMVPCVFKEVLQWLLRRCWWSTYITWKLLGLVSYTIGDKIKRNEIRKYSIKVD